MSAIERMRYRLGETGIAGDLTLFEAAIKEATRSGYQQHKDFYAAPPPASDTGLRAALEAIVEMAYTRKYDGRAGWSGALGEIEAVARAALAAAAPAPSDGELWAKGMEEGIKFHSETLNALMEHDQSCPLCKRPLAPAAYEGEGEA